jgi:hypothetical protein
LREEEEEEDEEWGRGYLCDLATDQETIHVTTSTGLVQDPSLVMQGRRRIALLSWDKLEPRELSRKAGKAGGWFDEPGSGWLE